MNKLQLFVSERYLEARRKISKEIIKKADEIEKNYVNSESIEAGKKYLFSKGGVKPEFSNTKILHYQLRDAFRVFYIYTSNLKEETRSKFNIPKNAISLLDISDKQDHDINDKKAIEIQKNMDDYTFRKMFEDLTLNKTEGSSIHYGFPIDENQKKLLSKESPLVVIGSAGSGKTITAVELLKKFLTEEKEKRTCFVTLTEKLRNKVLDELDLTNFNYVSVLTFADFSKIEYKEQSYYIDQIDNIIKTLRENLFDQKFRKLTLKYEFFFNGQAIYTIIRGYIKGRLDANKGYYQNNYRENLVEILDNLFKEENYNIFFKEDSSLVKKYIIQIFNLYQQQNLNDDNDFNPIITNKWECIIVDEVQDLTEFQIKYITDSLDHKSKSLYFYGDPNQTINPTFFSFNRLKGILQHFRNFTLKLENLKQTYRSGPNLIKYINHLSDIRRTKIGTQSDAWDEHEISKATRSDEKWAALVEKNNSLKELFSLVTDAEDCIIVVNDEKAKNQLKIDFPKELGNTELILTISQIKGLENKNIIVYNLISANLERFKEIISLKFKKSTIHRMILNRYYVALTRATKSLIICEIDINKHNELKSEFFNYQLNGNSQKVEEVDDNLSLIENYITKSDNPEAFIRSAKKFKENGFYEQAFEKFKKAKELISIKPEYIYLSAKIAADEEMLIEIVNYLKNRDKYSISSKRNFVEKMIIFEEYRITDKLLNETQELADYKSLINYLKGETSFESITDLIINQDFVNDEIYKLIMNSPNLSNDVYKTILNCI
jgi:hypothetical protein